MAGVTDQGFEPKTNEEVKADISNRANSPEFFGETFPTTPDSGFGVQTGVIAPSITDVWQLGQAVADQQNRDTATGIYLDYLAGLIGLERQQAQGSTGGLVFTGNAGAVIEQFFPVSDDDNRNVLTQSELTLSRTECYQSTFSVKTIQASTLYTINVLGVDYSYTSSASPTESAIIAGLLVQLQTSLLFTAAAVGDTILLTYTSPLNLLSSTNTNNLQLGSVGSLVIGEAAVEGALSFPANTIVNLVGTNINVSTVTNPSAFELGRDQETDEELRVRMSLREQSTGTATKPSIEASLSEVDGVTFVLVKENQTLTTDMNGIPPKAYETFLSGGTDEDIGDVIWETKPAGILTHGDITRAVIDHNGDVQTVMFSRPTPVYAWMRVTYAINSEEIFPSNGETLMKEAVVASGESMYNGEDYEATKFYGPLYTVPGMYVSLIEIATTPNPGDVPVYTTALIPVEDTEDLRFDVSRIVTTI